MAEDPTTPENHEPSSEELLQFARVHNEGQKTHEKYKLARLIVLCVTFLVGLAMVCWTLAVMNSPAWMQLAAIIAGVALPASVAWRLRGRFQALIQRQTQESIKIQASVDAYRTSSGLKPDGTADHD